MIKLRGIALIADGYPDASGDQILKENVHPLKPLIPVFEDSRYQMPIALAQCSWEEEKLVCEFEVDEETSVGKIMAFCRDNYRRSFIMPSIIGTVEKRSGENDKLPMGITITGIAVGTAPNSDKRIRPIWVVT